MPGINDEQLGDEVYESTNLFFSIFVKSKRTMELGTDYRCYVGVPLALLKSLAQGA